MTLLKLIKLLLQGSILLSVFGLGLRASISDAVHLFKHPGLLFRSVLSMNVVVPLFAIALTAGFNLTPAVKLALITLALSPVPPILPRKQFKLEENKEYVFGLLVAMAMLSVVIMPLAIALIGAATGRDFSVEPIQIAKVVSTTVLLPLLAGIIVRHFLMHSADRVGVLLTAIGFGILIVAIIPLLWIGGSAIISLVGNGTLLAMAAMVIVGLITGHLLGGPNFGDRAVLALASATRHPAVAFTVAAALFPDQRKPVLAAILLYILVNMVVSIPYMAWCKRHERPTATATV